MHIGSVVKTHYHLPNQHHAQHHQNQFQGQQLPEFRQDQTQLEQLRSLEAMRVIGKSFSARNNGGDMMTSNVGLVNKTGDQKLGGSSSKNSTGGEYLTFLLGSEEYGLDILKVQEIRGYDAVTNIANTPECIKGVVNLRGKIVPIVDLRIKLNLGKAEYNEFTVVIILNLHERVVGIVVDGVSDVIAISSEQIRDVPSLVTSIDTKYIVGLAAVEEVMLILVDIEQLMSSQDMALFDSAAVH